MSTTLEPDFLLAVIRMVTFKGAKMIGAQAGLLHLALRDLPGELTAGSKHIAGAATGALIAQGLIVVVDRIKSPDKKAKGRKLDVLRLGSGQRSTVLAWLRANNLPVPEAGTQMGMAI